MDKKWWAFDIGAKTICGVESIGWIVKEDECDEEKELEATRIKGLWYQIETHKGLNELSLTQ